ncbi:hypothetical protein KFU94_01250 [Chloroflexi bacterium TSY]|nr:hypothetical protein [Chloroflexi bacterium TSY]
MAEHSIDRYDGLGRLIQHTERNRLVDGATTDVVSVHRYDALGRETCASQPFTVADGSGLQPPQSCTSQAHVATQYDSVGRIQQAIKADGTRTVHSYGIEAGLAVHDVIDANRHRKRSSSDVLGRLAEVVEMIGNCDNEWAVDGFGCQSPYETEWSDYAVTRYSYDTLGQLIAVVNDATGTPVTSTMEYDSLGRKIAMSDPDMGDWQYAYDVAGNRVLQIDAKGDRVCSYYDELNRLIARGSMRALPAPTVRHLQTAPTTWQRMSTTAHPTASVNWPKSNGAESPRQSERVRI